MARSVEFYKKLGFELSYGGDESAFSSLKAGEAFVNLVARPGYDHPSKIRAPCGNAAREDLCGGCWATGIPTATK